MANVQGVAVLHGVRGQAQKLPHLLSFDAQVVQALQDPGLPSDHVQNAAAGGESRAEQSR